MGFNRHPKAKRALGFNEEPESDNFLGNMAQQQLASSPPVVDQQEESQGEGVGSYSTGAYKDPYSGVSPGKLGNPFKDPGIADTASSVGFDPAVMGGAADAGLANGASSDYLNPLAGEAESGMGGYVGAGVQAAATTADIISKAVQAQNMREFQNQQGDLNRALETQLNQMNINESKYEANSGAKNNAYQMLLSSINSKINATLGGVQNIRNAGQGFDSLLSQAYLR